MQLGQQYKSFLAMNSHRWVLRVLQGFLLVLVRRTNRLGQWSTQVAIKPRICPVINQCGKNSLGQCLIDWLIWHHIPVVALPPMPKLQLDPKQSYSRSRSVMMTWRGGVTEWSHHSTIGARQPHTAADPSDRLLRCDQQFKGAAKDCRWKGLVSNLPLHEIHCLR